MTALDLALTEIKPLAIGTPYNDATITEVVSYDESDAYQPFLYMLSNGETVWIPVGCECDNTHKQNDTVCMPCWRQVFQISN